MQARSDDGEAIAWKGQVSLAPVSSRGAFTLRGLQSKTIADFVGDLLPFRLMNGRVDLGGDYTFALPKQGGMQLDARLPKIDARDLRLRAQGVDSDWVVVPSATVTDTRLSLARREVSIGALRVDGAQVEAWMEPRRRDQPRAPVHGAGHRSVEGNPGRRIRSIKVQRPVARVVIARDGTLNLATTLGAATPATPQARATPAKNASTLPPLKVGEVRLAGGTMQFADFSVQPNFQAKIEALQGRIANISTAPRTVSQIDLSGHVINRYSPVTIKGSANLLAYDERTHLAMQFRNIELPIFNPYSGKWAGYAIAKGKLTTELDYTINDRTRRQGQGRRARRHVQARLRQAPRCAGCGGDAGVRMCRRRHRCRCRSRSCSTIRTRRVANARPQRRSSEVAWLESQLRPRYRADATAADQLAKARAAAVQDALLANGKVDPVRVFLDATKSTQEEKGKMRMELALE